MEFYQYLRRADMIIKQLKRDPDWHLKMSKGQAEFLKTWTALDVSSVSLMTNELSVAAIEKFLGHADSAAVGLKQMATLISPVVKQHPSWLDRQNAWIYGWAEIIWKSAGRPYYNIYPDFIRMFSKTTLNVPVSAFVMPHPSFVVQFPVAHSLLVGGRRVGAIKLSEVTYDNIKASKEFPVDITDGYVEHWKGRHLHVVAQFMPPEAHDQIYYTSEGNMKAEVVEGLASFEDIFKDTLEVNDEVSQALKTCLRIAVAVCFLQGGYDSELVEGDILKKDLEAYAAAVKAKDEKKVKELTEKADRVRGTKGRAIGKQEYLMGIRYVIHDKDGTSEKSAENSDETKHRELQYRHVRRPHFRLVKTGEGRKDTKVKLIKAMVIRKDLPPKPEDHTIGFRTPKTLNPPQADGS